MSIPFPWRNQRRIAIPFMAIIVLGLLLLTPAVRASAADGDGWRPIGPDGGTEGVILVHPTDPNRIFIGADRGLFRSDDGGEHWRMLYVRNTRIGAPQSIVLHPTDPDILYALFRSGTYPLDIKVFVSYDGGESWLFRFSPPPGDNDNDIIGPTLAIAPSAPDSLYLAANRRLYKSEDGGLSWKMLDVSGHQITAISVTPTDANIVYAITAGGSGVPSRVLKSEDAGAHWAALNGPTDWGIRTMAVHPSDPATLFISVSDGLYVSRDGGRSWSKTGLDVAGAPSNISISPATPNIMYAISMASVFKSEDGGVNWRIIDDPLASEPNSWNYRLTAHPTDPDTLFISGKIDYDFGDPVGSGHSGKVFRSNDGGEHWTHLNQGLPNGAINDFAFSSTTGALYAVGGQGAFRRDANSSSWVPINDGLGEASPIVYQVAISRDVPETLYIISASGGGEMALYASEDEGKSWRRTGPITQAGPPKKLIVAPTSPPVLYLVNGAGEIEKSWDEGASWKRLGGGGAPTSVRHIAVDPTDPNRLYATDARGPWEHLLQTANGGQQWREISLPAPPTEFGVLEPLAVDPDGVVYVREGVLGALLRSNDHGQTWERMDAAPLRSALYDIAFDPMEPDHLVIAADDGVSISWDRGRSWVNAGQPLSTFYFVRQITLDPTNPQHLIVMSDRHGLYEREFAHWRIHLPLIGAPENDANDEQVDPTANGAWVQSARLAPDRSPQTVVQSQQLVTGLTHVQYWRGEETNPERARVAVILTVDDQVADCLEFPYGNRLSPIPVFPGQSEEYPFAFVAPEEPGHYNLVANVVSDASESYPPLCPQDDNWQSALPPNATRVIGEVVVQE